MASFWSNTEMKWNEESVWSKLKVCRSDDLGGRCRQCCVPNAQNHRTYNSKISLRNFFDDAVASVAKLARVVQSNNMAYVQRHADSGSSDDTIACCQNMLGKVSAVFSTYIHLQVWKSVSKTSLLTGTTKPKWTSMAVPVKCRNYFPPLHS